MCIPKLETYFGHQDQSLLDRHNTLLLYHDEDDIYQSDQSDVDDIDDIFVSDEETDDDIEEEHYGGIRQALIQSSDQYHHQSTNQQYQKIQKPYGNIYIYIHVFQGNSQNQIWAL